MDNQSKINEAIKNLETLLNDDVDLLIREVKFNRRVNEYLEGMLKTLSQVLTTKSVDSFTTQAELFEDIQNFRLAAEALRFLHDRKKEHEHVAQLTEN